MKRAVLLVLQIGLSVGEVPLELTSTKVTCGTKQINIEPALIDVADPIQFFKIGDCIFDSSTPVSIDSRSDKWVFDCGVSEMNETTGAVTDDIIEETWSERGLNATEWSVKYVTFSGTIEFHSNRPPSSNGILKARDFTTTVYTQQFYCHYERLWRQEVKFVGPSCEECAGCLIGGEVMLDETGTCPAEYQHFLVSDHQGQMMWVNNCTCEIILEPVGGEGDFNIEKGLFLDEHLERPYDPGENDHFV